MVLSVEAGTEIDFRMVDSLLALERNLQLEEFNAMSDLVEFRHLKYIVTVAEAATITRVAERLFLAQPSLSKQVKDFEDELGFPIFIRTRLGVRITPPGQMIVAYAQEALHKRTKIIAMARAVHRGEVPPYRRITAAEARGLAGWQGPRGAYLTSRRAEGPAEAEAARSAVVQRWIVCTAAPGAPEPCVVIRFRERKNARRKDGANVEPDRRTQ